MTVEAPGGARDILLHACCAPCSGAVLECLRDSGIRPVVFFSNSNIAPREEYELRLSELRRYGDVMGVEVVADEYDHDAWLAAVRGLEREPERGARCAACFRFRLARAARYAASRGLSVVATTLASSRWKDLDQVNAAGLDACGRVDPCKTVAARGLVNGGDPTVRLGGMSAKREVLQGSNPAANIHTGSIDLVEVFPAGGGERGGEKRKPPPVGEVCGGVETEVEALQAALSALRLVFQSLDFLQP